ncbi:GGDEF domain-containing protein [Ideonella sp. 4Y16]|uniref:GGDEF domain-containing protein n=1 Tax=Ideonella alba TaxID=2824118 RepID=UPI001B37F623|nr:GGDEF domain-containing protein [Ideonella alba]MBQ0944288.1 GGDEF domain-containing protein [Ideonella alba]
MLSVQPTFDATPSPQQVARCLAELTSLRDREQLQQRLAGHLVAHFRPRGAQVCRRRHDRLEDWDVLALQGAPAEPGEDERRALLEALGREHPLHLDGVPGRAFYPLLGSHGAEAVLALQLDGSPSEAHQQVADEILRVYRNVIGLLDYGERDSLTGLLNRKSFDETFMRLAGLSAQAEPALSGCDGRRHWHSGDPCFLAVIDIDHFKRVNDGFGHLVGDEVLLLVARLMGETLRQHDRLYRFGGEEFVVLLSCSQDEGARAALERLRERVAGYPFPQVQALTISAGFTRIDADDTPEQAFGRADKAVYAAKEGGRDQVRCFDELLAVGAVSETATGGVDFF